MAITETVLEMHYHKPLMDVFRETFGLGGVGGLNFYKYSPQREVFIGFDQAYAKTELTEAEFFALLKQSSTSGNYALPDKFIGYFLQFKVVSVKNNKMKHTPPTITSKPHYRCSLDTTKNVGTGLSQHELLFRLSKNAGAMVYYACPMLFDRAALYDVAIDLDTLRLPDLKSCPSEFGDNNQHYIYFNDPNATPVWCSEPVNGHAIDPKTFANLVFAKASQTEARVLADELLDLLTNFKRFDLSGLEEPFRGYGPSPSSMAKIYANVLTIVRITANQRQQAVLPDAVLGAALAAEKPELQTIKSQPTVNLA